MQAVILAAGQGTRLRPLTYASPKSLLRLAGKNLLEHNLECLPKKIDELIFVVGYLGDQIIGYFGNEFGGRKIKYVKQEELFGTGHALYLCKNLLKNRFLVMMGDDIYSENDIKKCLKHKNCMLIYGIEGKFAGGQIKFDDSGNLQDIIEGDHNSVKSFVNTGLYALTKDFFDYPLVLLEKKREYGLPQTLVKMAQEHPVKTEKADFWLQINDLDGLKNAENILKNHNKNKYVFGENGKI